MTRAFEHGPSFQVSEDTGSFQPAFFEAEYERLYAETLAEGPIGPAERLRLDMVAGAMRLSKEKIARIEEGIQRAYEARASVTLTDLENMPTDHGTVWDELLKDAATGERPMPSTEDISDADVLSVRTQPVHAAVPATPTRPPVPRSTHPPAARVEPPAAYPEKRTPSTESVQPPAAPVRREEPGSSADIHARFALAVQRGQVDRQFTAAAVMVRRKEATPEQQAIYTRLRSGVLPRPARPLTTSGWTDALIDRAQDRTTSEILGLVASAALFARVTAMRIDGVLPKLEPKRRQDPATSTVSAVRALGWCAATLGMMAPAVYLAPEAPVGLEIVPGIPPAVKIGGTMLSGKSVLELAFHCGRFMTWLREEYFICNLMPGIPQLEDVFLAALLIGDPEIELPAEAYERAALNRDVLWPILDEGRIARLRELTAKFQTGPARVSLRSWWGAAERTACRAGLLACGDLEVAAEVLLSEPLGPLRLAEVEDFWASEAAGVLRGDLGIAFV